MIGIAEGGLNACWRQRSFFRQQIVRKDPLFAKVSCTATATNRDDFVVYINQLLRIDASLVRLGEKDTWCRERESNPHGVATAGF